MNYSPLWGEHRQLKGLKETDQLALFLCQFGSFEKLKVWASDRMARRCS
jgi:hypothetical protein